MDKHRRTRIGDILSNAVETIQAAALMTKTCDEPGCVLTDLRMQEAIMQAFHQLMRMTSAYETCIDRLKPGTL